jgi:transposase
LTYRELNEMLMVRLDTLEKEVSRLRAENSELRGRLAIYDTPKNSRNSSIPPSRDENRPKKNQSLRGPTDRKVGGQPGRKGKTLEMVAEPDKIVELHPDHCRGCGNSLENIEGVRGRSRQIVDIPPIKAIYTEYRSFTKQCSCGCENRADFPGHVNAPIGYGPRIEGFIGYFHARQYLPFARMQEMFNDVFNINISEGGIHRLLNRFADKTTSVYDLIGQRVSRSPVIGTDETGVKVNGAKHWMWTWQTLYLTYIACSDNRGKATVDTHFPKGFPKATLLHDAWRAQMATLAKHHQTCIAHLLRHLNYLNEKYGQDPWSMDFKELLCRALELNKKFNGKEDSYIAGRNAIVRSLSVQLENPPDKSKKELFTFYKRMCRDRQQLLVFLFIENVPPDNNTSEQAIRNVKVKQKISGQFKNPRYAQNFAKIRSVIDTTIKNGRNVIQALSLIAEDEFQLD